VRRALEAAASRHLATCGDAVLAPVSAAPPGAAAHARRAADPRPRAQAGDRVDVGGAEGAEAAARGTAGGQSYLVAVVERPAASAGGYDAAAGRSDEVEIGVVAVETSTGDILFAQFRCATARPSPASPNSLHCSVFFFPDSVPWGAQVR